jgi:succinate dehydrogenase/fumarate reductase cytochrome b subunit (b558 family)
LRSTALARRIFSLSGVVPLGAFLVLHVVTNARALRGEFAFEQAVRAQARIPGLPVVEALVVFAPLLVHAAMGAWLVATRRPLGEGASPYPRALAVAMRATGVVAIVFLALHLPDLRFRAEMVASLASPASARPDGGVLLTLLAAELSSTWHGIPLRAVAYLAGSACVVFHFAAGLWGFFARTERGVEARARLWAAWAAAAVGASMWLLLVGTVVFHATGARLFGSPAAPVAHEPCPPDTSR